jgi:dTDP-4-dehydrorhamnose reductase
MAGHVAAIKLAEYGHGVTGFARKQLPFCATIVGDAMCVDLSEIVKDFDAVINCIGVLNKAVDADPVKGIWLNSCLPHLLAKHAKRMIHISSDCVFSGHDGGRYAEDDYRSSDTMYGRSKALGELDDGKNLSIRTSIVGPEIKEGVGLFHWFMKQSGTVTGYTHAVWGGVSTMVLADAAIAALAQGTTGLVHLTSGKPICKFDLLRLFNKLRSEPVEIVPTDAVRDDKSLVCTRKDFDFAVPAFETMIDEMQTWINSHSELYQHYDTKRADR